MDIERIGEARYDLGEGPLWDPADGVLYFVDSLAPAVFRHDPASGAIARRDLPGATVGSLALRAAGGMVLAMDDGFHAYDFETGALETIAEPEAGVANTRFNDGKVDRQGRFIAGSLERNFAARSGTLYRLDADLSVARIEDRVVCTNGPCWSPDGATFYFTDGGRDEIYAYDYDAEAGTVANRRVFAAATPLGGNPDGATVRRRRLRLERPVRRGQGGALRARRPARSHRRAARQVDHQRHVRRRRARRSLCHLGAR